MAWLPTTGGAKIWNRMDDVVLTGSFIDQMNDKSGNSNHATATGSQRATLITNQLDGNDIARFDGVGNFYTFGNILDSIFNGTAAKFSMYMVAKLNGTASVQTFISKEHNGAAANKFSWFSFNDAGAMDQEMILNGPRNDFEESG